MGWGQPAAGPNGVVHYAYAGRGANPGDLGDIFYIRSDDNGTTWSAPIVLNSDAAKGGNKTQRMPSGSVTPEGNVVVSWYAPRSTGDGQKVSQPDRRRSSPCGGSGGSHCVDQWRRVLPVPTS